MPFIKISGLSAAVVAMALPQLAMAQYLPETTAIMQRLQSDPRVPFALQAIREGYFPAPDLSSAVNRCVAAASMIPRAPVRLQADACLRTMVGGLDPLSAYLSPQDLKLLMGAPGEGEGAVGLEVRKTDRGAEIVAVIDGTPGAQAGVGAGTLIVAIDGNPTVSMSLPEVASALRGAVGSTVSLEIMPPESTATVWIEVRRERIRQASVTAKVMDGQLGYLRVRQFSGSLAVQLAESLRSLLILQLRPVKGIIVDLRDCPGGLLHGAIALAAVFLPEDAVVTTITSRREGERKYRARLSDASSNSFDPRPLFADASLRAAAQKIPLVVLVNNGTASGAEVVAAALQEAGRAHVVGQATAGIGSVQTILPMKDQGAIRLTTEIMRTASGKSWAEHGVSPDYSAPRRAREIAEDDWIEFAMERLTKN